MRTSMVIPSLLLSFLLIPGGGTPLPVQAQENSRVTVGGGVGGTYYCIITRCNTGTTLTALVGYSVRGPLSLEGSVGSHHCFDCDSFRIGEGGIRLDLLQRFLRPSLALGVGVISDPEFLDERKAGPYLALGLTLPQRPHLGVRLDLRGREVGFGRGDYMGEVSLLLLYSP